MSMIFVFCSSIVWGHSFVEDEAPTNNSQLASPPTEIKIAFNNISSNDGHLIQDKPQPVQQNELHLTAMHENHTNPNVTYTEKPPQITDIVIYILKIVYYFGLLLIVGWVLWWRIIQNYSTEVKKRYLFSGMILQMVHLVGLNSVILIQLNVFSENEFSFELAISGASSFGLLWLVSLFVSLTGFLFLFKNQWFDLIWILVIVLSKSLNGHSALFEPVPLLVVANSIHLLTAAFWAAGLTFILLFWQKQRLYVKTFIPIFSEYALASLAVLAVTGSYLVFRFVPSWDLFFTEWGITLLIKLLFVLFVFLTGAKIRSKMKDLTVTDLGKWLRIDVGLMVAIILLVSILTYLNPLP